MGLSTLHVEGGRIISEIEAVLPGGRALAQTSDSQLVAGPLDHPPEEAKHKVAVDQVDAIDVSPDGSLIAVHTAERCSCCVQRIYLNDRAISL